MQGDWRPVASGEASELLALVHDAALTGDGVCLHGSENEPPLPSRKALAALRIKPDSATDSASLAGACAPGCASIHIPSSSYF